MPWVFIPEEWGPDRTKLMNQYIIGVVELLTLYTGPDELGLAQVMEELNADQEMFQAVWAHLYTWQRNLLIDIRERHDRRGSFAPSPYATSYHGRELRRTKG